MIPTPSPTVRATGLTPDEVARWGHAIGTWAGLFTILMIVLFVIATSLILFLIVNGD